ncbi:MAG: hypothetical protein QXV32_05530 [Conexivisphaerales archaeon]
MQVFLMHKDRDFDLNILPENAEELVTDLGMEGLIGVMSSGDKFIATVVKTALLQNLTSVDTIKYRQDILLDFLDKPGILKSIYLLATNALEEERKNWFFLITSPSPDLLLYRSVAIIEMFSRYLRDLRDLLVANDPNFKSEGLKGLVSRLVNKLTDNYFEMLREKLRELKFEDGMLFSVRLGEALKGTDYTLRKQINRKKNWRFLRRSKDEFSFEIADRDEAGADALAQLRERAVNDVANLLAQSAETLHNFFTSLKAETGFYIGCLNLVDYMKEKNLQYCFPSPLKGGFWLSASSLYDISLAINGNRQIVPNDIQADGKRMIVITGANEGGKSTFLKSIGMAFIMMQCGMVVCAKSFKATICEGLFTHFRKKEDQNMQSGKLEEELIRLNKIVANLKPSSIILMNESLASTNEHEGSEIAMQVTEALVEGGVRVFFVTHLYDFAARVKSKLNGLVLFLKAERLEDGTRTFRIIEGEPLATSFGRDLYKQIFEDKAQEAFLENQVK